ncbi:MAG: sensor histidine kinase KdpD [Sphingomonadales bacterium]|nr:sensor histidine kinase KdpD [Sphingomonadales bacterium]
MRLTDRRPSPEALLRAAARERRGRLKIFLGAAPGVGKTFEMLREGAERLAAGVDVVIAVVETHGRQDTERLAAPLPTIPRRRVDHRGHALEEMDLDAVLARAPQLALVDELAHTNAEGCRHAKRWQDVEELLEAGIDVHSTLNIQHVESLNDVVASFTRVRVRETVPDHVLEGAEIEVVDLPPDELIERLQQGKVYVPAEATRALGHFFSKENLSALREMALRRAAQNVDRGLVDFLDAHAVAGTYAGGERVLVAVNELPGSDALVRAGKRLSDALRAPWQAVFIETPRAAALGPEERRRVADSLQLAASLGATIASVPAETVIEGLTTHIAGMRATQLVLGRSRRSWWFELRHGSVVERLLRVSEGLAVHVIPSEAATPSRGPARVRRRVEWRGIWAGMAAVAVTTGLAELVEPVIGGGGIDLIYLLPVILISVMFGRWPGIATGVIAGLAYNFFFLPPIYAFTIADPQSVLTVIVLLGIAVFVASLADRLRTRASVGARSAIENAAVAAFGQALARASDWQSTGDTVCTELARALDVSVLLLVQRDGQLDIVSAYPADMAQLSPVDRAAAEWAWSHGEVTGCDTGTLNAADWQFHPLRTTLGTLAVVALTRGDGGAPVPATRATLLSTLLGQAALAHERLRLEDQLREVKVIEERDRLRSALLSSIGHDLRTPLTAVGGALDAIAVNHPDEPALGIARGELARLRRFLANLIEMVRIDSGTLAVAIEPVDLTDAVAGAVHDVRDLLPDARLDFRVPPDLPLVPADPRLLHHILLNLLTNAATHGAGKVTITGERLPRGVRLSIADQGPGLPPGGAAALFEAFARGTGSDSRGGRGLGLAIARSFSEVMNVEIGASDGDEGGAVFALDFAID